MFMSTLSPREEKIALALASAAIPPGEHLPGGDSGTVKRLEKWIEGGTANQALGMRGLLWAAEAAAAASTGTRLSKMPRAQAEKWLETWRASTSHARRSLVRAVLSPIKIAHFGDAAIESNVGCKTVPRALAQIDEGARWRQQVIDGRDAAEDLELECEVVVIGSGAGGAACA